MANICLYKVKVKGTKKACYKLVHMMPLYSSEKEYISEEGSDDDFTLVFSGDCKWSVHYRTTPQKDLVPFTEEEIDKIQDGDGWEYTLQDKSLLLNCEIFCNSKDIDDVSYACYDHYNRGVEIFDECPKELHIKRGRDYDADGMVFTDQGFLSVNILANNAINAADVKPTCKVKFESGTYWYLGDFEVGDLVYTEGAKKGCLGKVVEKSTSDKVTAIYNVVNCVGHIGEFISEDIEAIWNSYKAKARKEYLKALGLDESLTKKKFISLMENKWTSFAQKENDWNQFLDSLKIQH